MCSVSIVNASIGLEILLKSFLATPVENERKGTFGEQYKMKRNIHSLSKLVEEIDTDISHKLGFYKAKHWFKSFDELFVKARYPYEPDSQDSYSEVPIDLGITLLKNTIKWYQESGSDDKWIKAYPDVPGGSI